MINVVPVWKQGITGTGVRVRVNDNGVDSSHVELTGRFDTAGSCTNFAPQTDDPKIDHGTSVAGIVGAAANNGVCSVGIAPSVTISACNVFVETDALTQNMGSHDISQNSYGTDGCRDMTQSRRFLAPVTCPFTHVPATTSTASPCDVCQDFSQPSEECAQAIRDHCSDYYAEDQLGCLDFLSLIIGGNCAYDALTDYEREALTQGVVEGRQGKGIIYLFASGNAFDKGDETTFQSYSNSRFVISVGAVAKDRTHASYSTPGSTLFVTGPGGDSGTVTNHVTIGFGKPCSDAGMGTSFACPVVTGVVALILEVNPNLTWRDVQYILAQTSQRVDDPQDTTAFQNAAGYWHSHWYGFGIVDAEAAVTAARDWVTVGPEQMVLAESGLLNQPIVDDESVFLETSATIKAPANFSTESVELQLDIDSFSRGDLEIILTSPQGTQSILSPGRRPENTQVADRWKLLTVRHWGENPNCEWTLTIVDLVRGDVSDCGSQAWSGTIGDQFVDCNYLESMNFCADGQLDPTGALSQEWYNAIFTYKDNGVLAEQACCACGGGMTASQLSDQLKQWTLVVYGTNQTLPSPGGSTPAPATTKTPNTVPTRRPVQSPTRSPTSGTGTVDQSEPTPPTVSCTWDHYGSLSTITSTSQPVHNTFLYCLAVPSHCGLVVAIVLIVSQILRFRTLHGQ
jgi:subtilisin family serine protease